MYVLKRNNNRYFNRFELRTGELVTTDDLEDAYKFKDINSATYIQEQLNSHCENGFAICSYSIEKERSVSNIYG